MWWVDVVKLAPPVLAVGAACVATWYAIRAHRARVGAEAEARRAEHYAARSELARRRTCEHAKRPPTGGVTEHD